MDLLIEPAEQVRRVKAALAEAGHPDAIVMWGRMSNGEHGLLLSCSCAPCVPPGVFWRALVVADPEGTMAGRCWPCHRDGRWDCTHDYRTEPWPALIPEGETT